MVDTGGSIKEDGPKANTAGALIDEPLDEHLGPIAAHHGTVHHVVKKAHTARLQVHPEPELDLGGGLEGPAETDESDLPPCQLLGVQALGQYGVACPPRENGLPVQAHAAVNAVGGTEPHAQMLPGHDLQGVGVGGRELRGETWRGFAALVDPDGWSYGEEQSLQDRLQFLGSGGAFHPGGAEGGEGLPVQLCRFVAGMEVADVAIELGEGPEVVDLGIDLGSDAQAQRSS